MKLKVFIYTLFIFCFAFSANATGNISGAGLRTDWPAMPAFNHLFSADLIGNSEEGITIADLIPFREEQNEKPRMKFRIPSVITELATLETGVSRNFHLIASIGSVRTADHCLTLPYYYLFLFRLTPF